jgi:hypothetical protein
MSGMRKIGGKNATKAKIEKEEEELDLEQEIDEALEEKKIDISIKDSKLNDFGKIFKEKFSPKILNGENLNLLGNNSSPKYKPMTDNEIETTQKLQFKHNQEIIFTQSNIINTGLMINNIPLRPEIPVDLSELNVEKLEIEDETEVDGKIHF